MLQPLWLHKGLICLLLGTATTVAFAWTPAIARDGWLEGNGVGRAGTGMMGGEQMSVRVTKGLAHVQVGAEWVRSQTPPHRGGDVERWWRDVAPAWADLSEPVRTGALFGDLDHRRYDGFGWPCVALWRGKQFTTHVGLGQWDAWFSAWTVGGRALPAGIYLTGFAIDVVVFACGWMTIILLAGHSRRFVRRRRGRCLFCGYDLRGEFGSGCPECGWGRSSA